LTYYPAYATLVVEVVGMGKNLRIKSARAAKDMSQKDLAEAVGVARQTMNAIEKGDYNPTIKLCLAICKALGKTRDQLFWEDDDNEEQ
jgi:putative transcriptional regulator